jgi:hypothetical protein
VQVIGPPNGEVSVLALSARPERHWWWAGVYISKRRIRVGKAAEGERV